VKIVLEPVFEADSPEGYPQTPPYAWWNYHDAYGKTP
jgi:hypothetical protein